MSNFKDVEVGGKKYQIGKFRARDGSWVLAQVLTKMLPVALESALKDAGAALASNRAVLSEDEFFNLQGHALAVVRAYNEHGVPLPVFVRPDSWPAKDLEFDLTAVIALTVHSLVYNLSPFFLEGGLATVMNSMPGLAALQAPPSSTIPT